MKNRLYLYLFPLLLLIPIFIFRDYTPDNELRYISIIEEALRNGSFFAFYNQGVAYADKPPLYFWLLMACRELTGANIMWLIGLFTLIPSAVIFWIMNKMSFGSGAKANLTPALMLLTSVMFIGSAVVLRMDMLMVMFIVLALYHFYKQYKGIGSRGDSFLLPFYIFMALFSKGPVGVLVPILSIALFLAFEGKIKRFGKYLGWRQWLIIVGLSLIWFSCVFWEGGYDYIHNLLYKQTVGRGINSFHHKEPFYYYIKTIWYALAPFSLLGVVALVKGFSQRIIQRNTLLKFYSVIIISTFVMMSLISSKIDIYLLPIYPFFIYTLFILIREIKPDWMMKTAIIIPAFIFVLMPFSLIFIQELLPVIPDNMQLVYGGVAILSMGGIGGVVYAFKGNIARACLLVSVSLLFAVFVISFTIPYFNDIIGLRNLSEKSIVIAKENQIDSYSFYQFRSGENMDVYLGQKLNSVEDIEELKLLNNTILFIRQREINRQEDLRDFLMDKEPEEIVGDYKIYVIK